MAGSRRRQLKRNTSRSTSPSRSKSLFQSVGLFLVLIVLCIGISTFHQTTKQRRLRSSSSTLYKTPNDIPTSILQSIDAILVLGGGPPTTPESPPVYVQKRCDDAVAVVHQADRPIPILCLSAGTTHAPQLLSSQGLPVWESTGCAGYLLNHHHLQSPVYTETTSFDTIGNAFYGRVSHTDLTGWSNLLIITNEVGALDALTHTQTPD